jgi:predicted site-specific integrase-resolvase
MKPHEMAERIGVSVKTLQRWDAYGTLVAYRTPTNRRYYTEEQYLQYINRSKVQQGRHVAYARVSSTNQKNDLKNQEKFLRDYVNSKGIILDDYIHDIGSGLNYKRKHWNKLLEDVMKGEIHTIYITYEDRFIRFGFDWFEELCTRYHTKIEVLNNPNTSPEQELVEDLISIIHVFSCRIYGLLKYKKKIMEDKEVEKSI